LRRRNDAMPPHVYRLRRRHLWLSSAYVFGCAFRSLLPRADVQRIVLHDSFLSSVLVGRSVATIAELCFVAQLALVVREIAVRHDSRTFIVVSRLIVPLIAVAEIASWSAVVTTNYLGNVIEESIWTLTGALLVFSFISLWPLTNPKLRRFFVFGIVFGVGYVIFMCTVDVRMYLTRFLADHAAGRSYLSIADGLRDLATRWTVTFAWDEWREEIPWMSLYFSVSVWTSIALVRASAFAAREGDAGEHEAVAN